MRIDEQMSEILKQISAHARIAISSDPGSGKSTRIPPALVKAGYRVLVLEPRRISAISLAAYISDCQNTEVGRDIGYQVRGDTKRSADTRALFATEALLPKYLDQDPTLSEWDVVILDEFHERHIHTDVAWALLNQIQKELRPELKIILLSATLNLTEIQKAWSDVSIVHIINPPHALELRYIEVPKGLSDSHALRRALVQTLTSHKFDGDVLVFLAGYGEIERCRMDLLATKKLSPHTVVMELYGSQSLAEQRRVLQKIPQQKIILATNVAESSITIDGVRTVIDTGQERVAWANSKSGLTELKTERISKSSATQRAGRAARQAPGTCYRLWSEAEQSALDEFHVAEIQRSDLSEPLYSIMASGWNPMSDDFAWLETPHPTRLQDSFDRLQRLGLASDAGKLGESRQHLAQYPIGLRGALYIERLVEQKCPLSKVDLTIAAWVSSPDGRAPGDQNYRRDAEAVARHLKLGHMGFVTEFDVHPLSPQQLDALARAIPDRAFERRATGSKSIRLSSSRGASLQNPHAHESEKFGFALMLRESEPDALVSLAVPMPKALYRGLVEQPTKKKPEAPQSLWDAPPARIQNLLQRAHIFRSCCLATFELQPVIEEVASALRTNHPKTSWEDLEGEILSWTKGMCDAKQWHRFESACPAEFPLPKSGSLAKLWYVSDSRVELHARLQEFLGCKDHPNIAEGQIPLTLVLLSPARRPIQITQRLSEFWDGSYLDIKKEMKARYPKHDW